MRAYSTTCLNPMMAVGKKNIKLLNYQELKATSIMDAFPFPFMDAILDTVASHEMYSFLEKVKEELEDPIHRAQHLNISMWGGRAGPSNKCVHVCMDVCICVSSLHG